jgi:hypothetical protein
MSIGRISRITLLFASFQHSAARSNLAFVSKIASPISQSTLNMSSSSTVPEVKVGDTLPNVVLKEGQVRPTNISANCF